MNSFWQELERIVGKVLGTVGAMLFICAILYWIPRLLLGV